MIIGELLHREKKYHFTLEDDTLYLDPMEEQISYGIFSYLLNDDTLNINERYLRGQCYPNGHAIIIVPKSTRFGTNNTTLIASVRYVFEFKTDECPICGITFSCDELDYIYDVNQCIALQTFSPNGDASVTTKPTKDTESNEGTFIFRNNNIKCTFGIGRTMRYGTAHPPLLLQSFLLFQFDETSDYYFLYSLFVHARTLIQLLCYRENISFNTAIIKRKDEDGRTISCGEIKIFNTDIISKEQNKYVKEQFIPHSIISGHVADIMQDIVDNKIYTEHFPESHRAGNIITPARFVMITAAFQWEFKRLFPDNLPKSKKHLTAETTVNNHLQTLIKETKGEEKKIYKRFLKLLEFADAMKETIVHSLERMRTIIDPLANRLYKLNGLECNYQLIGQRLGDQRNNFAHGQIDREYITESTLDLLILEYLIYALQLSHYSIKPDDIQAAIKKLFRCNI